ncbi:hypothetical protein MP228_003947 [Amoeboaphelidium protococcarum]|nr:hypothetical protein MP228_003947 [Amoeboaphelidium protococcarum]
MFPIDFEGQKLADKLNFWILNASGVLAFTLGFVTQSLHIMWYTLLAGMVISAILITPPWPFLNKIPLQWQKAAGRSKSNAKIDSSKSAAGYNARSKK